MNTVELIEMVVPADGFKLANGFIIAREVLLNMPPNALAYLMAYGLKQSITDIVSGAKEKGWDQEEQHKRQAAKIDALIRGEIRVASSRVGVSPELLSEQDRRKYDALKAAGFEPRIRKQGEKYVLIIA